MRGARAPTRPDGRICPGDTVTVSGHYRFVPLDETDEEWRTVRDAQGRPVRAKVRFLNLQVYVNGGTRVDGEPLPSMDVKGDGRVAGGTPPTVTGDFSFTMTVVAGQNRVKVTYNVFGHERLAPAPEETLLFQVNPCEEEKKVSQVIGDRTNPLLIEEDPLGGFLWMPPGTLSPGGVLIAGGVRRCKIK